MTFAADRTIRSWPMPSRGNWARQGLAFESVSPDGELVVIRKFSDGGLPSLSISRPDANREIQRRIHPPPLCPTPHDSIPASVIGPCSARTGSNSLFWMTMSKAGRQNSTSWTLLLGGSREQFRWKLRLARWTSP